MEPQTIFEYGAALVALGLGLAMTGIGLDLLWGVIKAHRGRG
jgi:hypothetical protein